MQPLPQRLALHERHDVIQQTGGLARVEQREDMRMAELGGEADLTEEALGAQHGAQLGAQDLDGHAPLVFPVLCEVNGCHPPLAQLALDRVAIVERSPKSIERVGHSRGPREVTGGRYVPRSRLWTSPPRRSRALPRDADSCVSNSGGNNSRHCCRSRVPNVFTPGNGARRRELPDSIVTLAGIHSRVTSRSAVFSPSQRPLSAARPAVAVPFASDASPSHPPSRSLARAARR